jgi:GntR family transcriptional regulator
LGQLLRQDYRTGSGVPKYLQIREAIRRLIEEGHFHEDQMLPPEREFCETFGVSRMTVRHALDELVREGMLERRTGNGTFVRSIKLTGRSRGSYGFSDELALAGKTTHTEVLEKTVVEASRYVSGKLRLPKGVGEAVRIGRLRFVDEHPISHQTSYLPYDLCGRIMEDDLLPDDSLYHYLTDRLGLDISEGNEAIQAVGTEEGVAGLLRVAPGSPCFLVCRVLLDGRGSRPVEYVETVLRGDKFMFVNRLEEKGR